MTNPETAKIVVVDDEIYICNIVKEALSNTQYQVDVFSDVTEGIQFIQNNHVDLLLTDLVMGEHSGVDVIDATLEEHSDAIVILMTAHPTVEVAIDVLKKGAYEFLVKPFKLELLRATIKRGLSHQKLVRDNLSLKEQVDFLKVATASASEVDQQEYMKLVSRSCTKELGAKAVSIFSVDPKSKKVMNKIVESDSDKYEEMLSDEYIVQKILHNQSHAPIIEKDSVVIDNQEYIQTLIMQPICSRRSLVGVINLVTLDKFDKLTQGQLDVLLLLSNSAASTFTNFNLYHDLEHSYFQAFTALANAIEARDAYTAGHTARVCRLAELIAVELGWNERELHNLRVGCTLHDIGKIGIPDAILNKQDKLSTAELTKMNYHPNMGLKIIQGIDLFKPAIPYIMAHHEKYDGTGYPNQLQGDEIPVEGRLLAVADTFDAILSDRPYRKGRSLKIAVEELVMNRGTQFDPAIVDTFLWVMKQGKVDFVEMYEREEDISQIDEVLANQKVSV